MNELRINSTASHDVELGISVLDSEDECKITVECWESMINVWIDKEIAIEIINHLSEQFSLTPKSTKEV